MYLTVSCVLLVIMSSNFDVPNCSPYLQNRLNQTLIRVTTLSLRAGYCPPCYHHSLCDIDDLPHTLWYAKSWNVWFNILIVHVSDLFIHTYPLVQISVHLNCSWTNNVCWERIKRIFFFYHVNHNRKVAEQITIKDWFRVHSGLVRPFTDNIQDSFRIRSGLHRSLLVQDLDVVSCLQGTYTAICCLKMQLIKCH